MGYGDELMVAGEAAAARAADPQRRRVKVLRKPGGPYRWSPVWEHNADMARPEEAGDFLILDHNAGRRYRDIEYPTHRVWTRVGPARPVLKLTAQEREWAAGQNVAGHVLLEPSLKSNAPVNKDWGRPNWEALARSLRFPLLQLGPAGTPVLPGVRHVVTQDFRQAAAVLERCRAAVLPEGGLHHAAAALGLRAVVMFGGYISPLQTGYPEHINLFPHPDTRTACGQRLPCEHCRKAMASISVTSVVTALGLLLGPLSEAA